MKSGFNKALAVGALVAVAGSAFLFAFTFFKKGGYSEKESYLVHARFADATGLTWKSRVQIAGIQVGEVSKIALEGNKALLQMRIRNDVELHTDACLYKAFPSALLPDALLEAVPGSADKPLLSSLPEAEREITCIREATSVQQLVDAMAKIASDVQMVTGDLAKTVNSDQGSLREIVENLARITRQVDAVVARNEDNLTQILENTRDFTGDLREISTRDKERIHSILRNVDELTVQLKGAAASVQVILDGGVGGVGGAGGAAAPVARPRPAARRAARRWRGRGRRRAGARSRGARAVRAPRQADRGLVAREARRSRRPAAAPARSPGSRARPSPRRRACRRSRARRRACSRRWRA